MVTVKNQLTSTTRKVENALIHEKSERAEVARRATAHLSKLFTVFSLAAGTNRNDSSNKDVWTSAPLTIEHNLEVVTGQIYSDRNDSSIPRLSIKIGPSVNGLVIQPWPRVSGKGKARLCDILYEEIFLELFINAAKYGAKDQNKSVQLSIEYDSELQQLFLTNAAGTPEKEHRGLAYCKWLLESLEQEVYKQRSKMTACLLCV